MDMNSPVTLTAIGLLWMSGGSLVLALIVGFFVGKRKGGRSNGKT